jgi:hypothetical protein
MMQPGGDLDLPQEPLRSQRGGELRPQHLDRDLSVMLEILGEINGGHAAPAELALDQVPVAQSVSQFGSGPVDHGETSGLEGLFESAPMRPS